jgi:hypothetical protein
MKGGVIESKTFRCSKLSPKSNKRNIKKHSEPTKKDRRNERCSAKKPFYLLPGFYSLFSH